MSDRRRAMVWPYVCVLVCLFVVCVTARRSWQPVHQPAESVGLLAWLDSTQAALSRTGPPPIQQTGHYVQPVAPVKEQVDVVAAGPAPARNSEIPVPEEALKGHLFARVATVSQYPNTDAPRPAASASQEKQEEKQDTDRIEKPETAQLDPHWPRPLPTKLARRDVSGSGDRARQPARMRTPLPTLDRGTAAKPAPQRLSEWSRPDTLLARLERLVAEDVEAQWARETAMKIHRLTGPIAPLVQEVPAILSELRAAADEVETMAERWRTPWERTHLLQARHGLTRRLDVWELVLLARQAGLNQTEGVALSDPDRLADCVAEVALLTSDGSETGNAWRQYLLLGTLQTLAEPTSPVVPAARRTVARRVLQRLTFSGLTRAQRQFVQQDQLTELDQQLRFWADEPIDLRLVLTDLERFESSAAPHDARRVAEHFEALACSPRAEFQALAQPIDMHYRNANFRIAISGELINQLLPQPDPRREPVRETIAGAAVRGRSHIATELFVRLLPDSRRIRVGLEAHGTVHSRTAAESGPATFFSIGRTAYLARKLILVGPQGTKVWPAVASADSQTWLQDIETSFDSWPLFGNLVRWIAESQHDQRLGHAVREVESKAAYRARRQLDAEADEQIARMEEALQRERQAALSRISLRAVPIDIHTTDQRIVARMRIAGPEQLGAHTARPRAPADSQLSLQLHESAVQNMLDELGLNGKQFTLPDLYRTVAAKLGKPDVAVPDDLNEHATVRFADRGGVRLQLIDGRAQVVLAIAELSLGRQRYRDFQVVACYRPAPSGLDPVLVRDGIIRLQGTRFRIRSQAVLRGVFARLFPPNRPIHPLPQRLAQSPGLAGLEIHQFDIDNGWIGLAVAARARARRRSPDLAVTPTAGLQK